MVVLGDSVVRSALSHFIHNLNNYDDDSVDDALDHVQELVDAHAKMKAEAEMKAEKEGKGKGKKKSREGDQQRCAAQDRCRGRHEEVEVDRSRR